MRNFYPVIEPEHMKQKDNPTINHLFLNLLSAAIWNKPADVALFEGIDTKTWNGIMDMARQQTVSALIADKALSLPKEGLPQKALSIQFMIIIQQTEALNRKMIQVLKDITQEYQEADFSFCLLKGLANGVNYPSPLLRNAGDIDLYLYRKGDYKRATELYTAKGFKIEDGSITHNKFIKDGVWIENHSRITFFDHKKYDNLYKEWEKKLSEKENFTYVQINGLTVRQLPVEMNAFFIFYHMFLHFVHDGVGFRQFCDWILFLSKHKDEIDPVLFTELAKSYALLYPMQVFARAAVKYLDAPDIIFPFEMIQDEKYADWITKDIIESGNFGFHRSDKQRPKEKFRGMWFSYKRIIRRSARFGVISRDHIRLLPINMLINIFRNRE